MIVLAPLKSGSKITFRVLGEPLILLATILCGLSLYFIRSGLPNWRSGKSNRILTLVSFICLFMSLLLVFSAAWSYALVQSLILMFNTDHHRGFSKLPLQVWLVNFLWLLVLVGIPKQLLGNGIQYAAVESCVSYYLVEETCNMCKPAWLVIIEMASAFIVGGQFLLTILTYLREDAGETKSKAVLETF